jgi:DNA-binding CsgD family transcriptional regulator
LSLLKQPRDAPGFVNLLAASLGDRISSEMSIPVPDGRLYCTVRRTQLLEQGNSGDSGALMVNVDLQFAETIAVIEFLFAKALTAKQREIAFHAVLGYPRFGCGERLGVGAQALKKHLQAIYRQTKVDGWNGLAELRSGIVANHAARITKNPVLQS